MTTAQGIGALTGRPLPDSIEDTLAEAAFVGCLLLSGAGEAARLLDQVDEDNFADERHRLALLAVRAVVADGIDPDAVVVNAWLRPEGHAAPFAPTDVGVWLSGLVELPTLLARARPTNCCRSSNTRGGVGGAGTRLAPAALRNAVKVSCRCVAYLIDRPDGGSASFWASYALLAAHRIWAQTGPLRGRAAQRPAAHAAGPPDRISTPRRSEGRPSPMTMSTAAQPFRELFATSRSSEYFDPKTLQSMVGQPRHRFGDVILKELVDNALDAAESVGSTPDVTITSMPVYHGKHDADAEPDSYNLIVEDNGPGLPDSAVERVLDFDVLVSDKEKYRSPTRGQQGNALKTVLGIPYALGVTEPVIITTPTGTHIVTPRTDPASEVVIGHELRRHARRPVGTAIHVTLPWLPDAGRWACDFALVNPHAHITAPAPAYRGNGDDEPEPVSYKPTVDDRWSKPLPTDPTSPWWYDRDSFTKLVFAHIGKARNGGRDKPLGGFLREFAGLTGTRKAKTVAAQFPEIHYLSDFEPRPERVADLLAAMVAATREPKPSALGQVPEEHYRQCFADWYGIQRFWFKRVNTCDGTVPYLVEVAVAETQRSGRLTFAVNYSPTFGDPTARLALSAGDSREALSATGVTEMLGHMDALPNGRNLRAAAVHLITLAAQSTDKGKTGLAVGRGTR